MAKKPLYIQLEPGAYPKDIVWQMMTAEERGCYHSLIIFLACNNGTLEDNTDSLAMVCNINSKKMKTFLDKFENKFIKKNGKISHKRVTDELRQAKKRMQVASASGLKGAKKRWGGHSDPIGDPNGELVAKERKGKERKDKVSKGKNDVTSDSSFPQGDGLSVVSQQLKFSMLTADVLKCGKNQSDRTTLKNVAQHLATLHEGNNKIFSKAYKIAQECTKGRKPIALFMSRMKDEFDYRKVL